MRYWVGFAVAVALVASPLTVAAQATKTPEPWLESEVERFGLEGLHGTTGGPDAKASRPAFALIPQHLKERTPQYRHERASLQYKANQPDEPDPQQRRRLRLGLGIGLGLGIPMIIAAGMGAALASMDMDFGAP